MYQKKIRLLYLKKVSLTYQSTFIPIGRFYDQYSQGVLTEEKNTNIFIHHFTLISTNLYVDWVSLSSLKII